MIIDWFSKWAVYRPDKIAIKEQESERVFSFQELNNYANQASNYLSTEHKITKGDRIAVLAENCVEYIILFAAAQKMGFILVPLNYRLSSAEINYLLQDAAPKLLLSEEQFQDKAIQTDFYENGVSSFLVTELMDRIQHQSTQLLGITNIQVDDPIFILYTSGSTGFPKGAKYTHKMLFWNSVNTAISLIVNTESRAINCMPPFHTGGWNVLTTPFLHHGGYTCLMKKFDAKTMLDLIVSERPTILFGVPTMMKMMADLPAFEQTDFSSILYAIVGGEAMPVPLIEKWHEKGVFIRQGYGMTEVGPNLTSLHQDDAIRKRGSIGRPNFYVQIKIVDENGAICETNQAGELLLKGDVVTPGYWKNERATKAAIKDNWFHTGDIVRQDEAGYLYVVDRIKNMYISGGENIYPAEVERVILGHPQISEVAIVAVADEKWGEVGKAFVVRKEDALSTQQLASYCREHLAKYKIPKYFEWVTTLPKNDTGKIDRKQLKLKAQKL
ncbi:MAG: long-chain fatty acid--CoA ligase [Bacteroidota bacterium]